MSTPNFFVLLIAGVPLKHDLKKSSLVLRAQELYACALGRVTKGHRSHARAVFMGFTTFEDTLHAFFTLNNAYYTATGCSNGFRLSCGLALDARNSFKDENLLAETVADKRNFMWLDDWDRPRDARTDLTGHSVISEALKEALVKNASPVLPDSTRK